MNSFCVQPVRRRQRPVLAGLGELRNKPVLVRILSPLKLVLETKGRESASARSA